MHSADRKDGAARGRRLRSRRGHAVVELALLVPVLLLFVVAAVDLSRAIDVSIALRHAAMAGARRAMVVGATDAEIGTAARNAAAPFEPQVQVGRGADSVVIRLDYALATVTPFAGLVYPRGRIPVRSTAVTLVP